MILAPRTQYRPLLWHNGDTHDIDFTLLELDNKGLNKDWLKSSINSVVLLIQCILAKWIWDNKANLRDLIAATGLAILLKFDPNHRFFSPCDLEIWCMTSKKNRAPVLYYIKLCASFQIHRWIQTEVTLRKRSIRVEIGNFLSFETLKFDGWPWKTVGHLFYTTPSFVYHFKSIGELKLKSQSGNAPFGSKSAILCPVWPWNLMDDLGKQ